MMKRYLNALVFPAFLATLTGCVAFENLTVEDVKTQDNLLSTRVFDAPIATLQSRLLDYANRCRPVQMIIAAPSAPLKGSIIITGPGMTKESVFAVISLEEKSGTTTATAYAYYSTWAARINDYFSVLAGTPDCPL